MSCPGSVGTLTLPPGFLQFSRYGKGKAYWPSERYELKIEHICVKPKSHFCLGRVCLPLQWRFKKCFSLCRMYRGGNKHHRSIAPWTWERAVLGEEEGGREEILGFANGEKDLRLYSYKQRKSSLCRKGKSTSMYKEQI